MSLRVNPTQAINFFNNVFDPAKAKQFNSVCLERCICHVSAQIDGHNIHHHCHCFLCRICHIMLSELFSRNHHKLLLIVNKNNYMSISDDYVKFKYLVIGQLKKKSLQRVNSFCLEEFKFFP